MAASSASGLDFSKISQSFNIDAVTTDQQQAISCLLKGLDVFLSTRTGSGKSLVYQAIPVVGKIHGENWLVLVTSPLISSMVEQKRYLQSIGIKASYIGEEKDQKPDTVFNEDINIVFGTPEALLDQPKWRNVLKMDFVKKRLKLLAVDEAHTVHQWGYAHHSNDSPFRESFSRIGELRSLCFHEGVTPPMLAITATASPLVRRKLRHQLCMMPNTVEIVDSPNRENIKLHVIFCRNKDDTGRLNAMFMQTIGKQYYHNEQPIIHVYHKDTTDSTKAKITEDMNNPDGIIRILLATNSAGMGVNFKNTSRIVNFGAPRDMDTLVQQLGRVGRAGEQSYAFLLYSGRHLKKVEPSVLEYLKGEECRRKVILSAYMATETADIVKHNCCDICHQVCKCTGTGCTVPEQPCISFSRCHKVKDAKVKVRETTQDDKSLLAHALEHQRLALLDRANPEHGLMSADLTHGFTKSVIDSVVNQCDFIACVDDILDHCSIYSYDLACTIYHAFQEVFPDMEELPSNY